ncbi:MAG: phosphotransferase family protein [Eubacteriales bacterium]
MPIIVWLNENTKLSGKIVCPVLTKSGQYKCEDDYFIYLLSPYINGYTLCDKEMDSEQINEIAEIISELHHYGEEIPVDTKSIKENFAVPFCDKLLSIIYSNPLNENEAINILHEYKEVLIKNIKLTQKLAQKLASENLHYVLCHTDVHGWNMIQADKLILIDWEGMKLAPPEAYLFAFIGNYFWHNFSTQFMETYMSINKNFIVNNDSLLFYQTRRRIEDICAFALELIYEEINKEDRRNSLYFLHKECSMLSLF